MNVVKCKNGHFFDGDSYTKCPHCGEEIGGASPQPSQTADKNAKKGFFGRGKGKEKSAQEYYSPQAPATYGGLNADKMPTEVLMGQNQNHSQNQSQNQIQNQNQVQNVPLKKNPTLDFWQTTPQAANVEAEQEAPAPVAPAEPQAPAPVEPVAPVVPPMAQEPIEEKPAAEVNNQVNQAPAASSVSLKEAIQKASASSEGKTMSYFSAATSSSSTTAAAPEIKANADPVVGWLVCIGGKHFGESFCIAAGKNSIGRNNENKIILHKDNSVSRSKHALIVYEPKKRNFYLQPGDSSGLTYLNDDYITESKKLAERDIIELGDSKFLFVPLCGETFSWEEYMPKE